jgi:hypothetical protein
MLSFVLASTSMLFWAIFLLCDTMSLNFVWSPCLHASIWYWEAEIVDEYFSNSVNEGVQHVSEEAQNLSWFPL